MDISGLDAIELDGSGLGVELDVSELDAIEMDISRLDAIELDSSKLDVEPDVSGLNVNSLEYSKSGAAIMSQSSNLDIFLHEVLSFLDLLL